MVVILSALLCALGCSRRDYRVAADADVANLISQRVCPQWMVPDRLVEADPRSRMTDLTDPDCPSIPPDDPAAHCWMQHPGCMKGSKKWGQYGELPFVEFEDWRNYLPVNESGIVELDQPTSIQLALLHSRDYQNQVESLYQQALRVSLERFEFDTRWFAGTGANYTAAGRRAAASRSLSVGNRAGFNRNFAAGGQFVADFANSFVWEFANGQVSAASSSLLFQLTQPLLRGAFRDVRLESLTQAERDLLYDVRDYAQFRREFYVDTIGEGGYLGLLELSQSIRNREANLEALDRNLQEHQALAARGFVAPIQVDQVYQDYEQGRLGLLSAQQSLESSLDSYKIQMGLPPTLPVALQEDVLLPFELNDPEFDRLKELSRGLRLELAPMAISIDVDEEKPSRVAMKPFFVRIDDDYKQLPALLESVVGEFQQLETQIAVQLASAVDDNERSELERQADMATRWAGQLEEIRLTIDSERREMAEHLAAYDTTEELVLWDALDRYAQKQFRAHVSDLFVIQAQVRVFSVEIDRVRITEETALQVAELNRLDLMNARARVVDAYRRVEVAADALEGDLDLVLETELGTDSFKANAFRFDSSANRYRAGLTFDSPVTRLAERNAYRSAQLQYQQARRAFMATKDEVARQIRADLRRLEFNRFQFEVTRQQLIAAARQVEQAELALRAASEADSSLTRDLLSALQQLLGAKNSLIGSWVSYESSRMNLFRDLATMEIDEQGLWINEYDSFGNEENPIRSGDNGDGADVDQQLDDPVIAPEPNDAIQPIEVEIERT